MANFDESKHPRDDDGKFTSGGGSAPHAGHAGEKRSEEYKRQMLAKHKVFDKVPNGWKPIEGATTAPEGYKWYSNGKSIFSDAHEQALIKVAESTSEPKKSEEQQEIVNEIQGDEELQKYDPAKIEKHLQDFCDMLTKDLQDQFKDSEYKTNEHFKVRKGGKYYKIIHTTDTGEDRSVHAFVDEEGNVYKPQSWNAPAQGIRANLKDIIEGKRKIDYSGGYLHTNRGGGRPIIGGRFI